MLAELKKKLKLGQKILLRVKVTPKSGRQRAHKELGDPMADGTIKIKLKSAAEDGKANKELIELLSDFFEVKEQNIRILTGKTSRQKLVEIHPAP